MRRQAYDSNQTTLPLFGDHPMVCTHCESYVCDATDPELERKIGDHLCGDARRWAA
jgi:hypothetical protein